MENSSSRQKCKIVERGFGSYLSLANVEALSCVECTLIASCWLSLAGTTSPRISLPVGYQVGVIHKRQLHKLWKVEGKQQVQRSHC